MRLAVLCLVLVLGASAACGGDDAGSVSINETEWMRAVCTLIEASDARFRALPEANQPTAGLTVAQRKARAASLWPKQIELSERFIADGRTLTPPPNRQTSKVANGHTGVDNLLPVLPALVAFAGIADN